MAVDRAQVEANRQRVIAGGRVGFKAEAPPDERTIDARWIVEAIRAGVAVDIENALVTGSLDLARQLVRGDFRLHQCELTGLADFAYAVFERTLRLESCEFHGGVCFDAARLRSDVWLEGSRFHGPDDPAASPRVNIFNDAEVAGMFIAPGVQFVGRAPVRFERVKFGSDAIFAGARFQGPLDMAEAEARGVIRFDGARFSRRAYLWLPKVVAARGIVLAEASFLGFVLCSSARFASLDAQGAIFGRGLDLSDARVDAGATFTSARFGRSARFERLHAGAVDLGFSRFDSRAANEVPCFNGAVVSGEFKGRSARFRSGLLMREARLGVLDLIGIRSAGLVDFFCSRIEGILNLGGAHLRAVGCALSLDGVDVDQIAQFDGARVRGSISAIGMRVQKQLNWIEVAVLGDVDFYELEVGRSVFMKRAWFGGALKLDRSRLAGAVFLASARCRGPVTFEAAHVASLRLDKFDAKYAHAARFDAGLTLQLARVGDLYFRGVTVGRPGQPGPGGAQPKLGAAVPQAAFNFCEVGGVADFTGACFRLPASFHAASFCGEALFLWVTFGCDTSFTSAVFKARCEFFGGRFDAEAMFSHARFDAAAIFRAWFDGKATFDRARFLGTVEFSEPATLPWQDTAEAWADPSPTPPGSRFGEASFVQARFSGDARFDSVHFDGPLDLRQAGFANLYLPTDDSREREAALLPKQIGLVGCRYERVLLRHPRNLLLGDGGELRLLERYDRQPFTQLEESLRHAGDDANADFVYLAGRRAEADTKHGLARLLDRGYGLIFNYGVRPWRLAGYAVLLTLAGAGFFAQPGALMPKDKDLRGAAPYQASWRDAICVSVAQLLPVALPIEDHLVPAVHPASAEGRGEPAFPLGLRPLTVATVLQLAGWILVPIGVASMTGLLMRKK